MADPVGLEIERIICEEVERPAVKDADEFRGLSQQDLMCPDLSSSSSALRSSDRGGLHFWHLRALMNDPASSLLEQTWH